MVLRTLVAVALVFGSARPLASAQAEEPPDEPAAEVEGPDPTRLDVERLPPEAIEVTRDLYAHGLFLEASVGARGFVNAIGDLVDVGPWATVGLGYELLAWLDVVVAAEGSMHGTSAPPPPAQTAFEVLGGSLSLRLRANLTPALAIWASAQLGIVVAHTDLLRIYGFDDASTVGVTYGGELGLDWHFRSRHHSIGLLAGVRHDPSFEPTAGGTSPAIGVHGSAYLRYVF